MADVSYFSAAPVLLDLIKLLIRFASLSNLSRKASAVDLMAATRSSFVLFNVSGSAAFPENNRPQGLTSYQMKDLISLNRPLAVINPGIALITLALIKGYASLEDRVAHQSSPELAYAFS